MNDPLNNSAKAASTLANGVVFIKTIVRIHLHHHNVAEWRSTKDKTNVSFSSLHNWIALFCGDCKRGDERHNLSKSAILDSPGVTPPQEGMRAPQSAL